MQQIISKSRRHSSRSPSVIFCGTPCVVCISFKLKSMGLKTAIVIVLATCETFLKVQNLVLNKLFFKLWDILYFHDIYIRFIHAFKV